MFAMFAPTWYVVGMVVGAHKCAKIALCMHIYLHCKMLTCIHSATFRSYCACGYTSWCFLAILFLPVPQKTIIGAIERIQVMILYGHANWNVNTVFS